MLNRLEKSEMGFLENGFGMRLRKARRERGFTQDRLGMECGACVGAVRAWEKGERLPNAYYLRKICIALHVSADYLLGIKGNDARQKKRLRT